VHGMCVHGHLSEVSVIYRPNEQHWPKDCDLSVFFELLNVICVLLNNH